LRFEILPLDQVIEKHSRLESLSGRSYRSVSFEALAMTLATDLGGDNMAFCDNLTCVETLVCHKPVKAEGGIDLYFRWPVGDRPERPSASLEEARKWIKR
jgi:hypothetical protein